MKKAFNFLIPIGVIALFFFLLIYVANINKRNKENKILENGKSTFATILYCGNKDGNFVSVEYFVNDKKYLTKIGAPSNEYQENEQIEIVYNVAEPANVLAHFYNMKFNNNIDFKEIEATIINNVATKIKAGNNSIKMLTYEYAVNGVKYSRTNQILITDDNKYSIGNKILILYNTNNPKSSIFTGNRTNN